MSDKGKHPLCAQGGVVENPEGGRKSLLVGSLGGRISTLEVSMFDLPKKRTRDGLDVTNWETEVKRNQNLARGHTTDKDAHGIL